MNKFTILNELIHNCCNEMISTIIYVSKKLSINLQHCSYLGMVQNLNESYCHALLKIVKIRNRILKCILSN